MAYHELVGDIFNCRAQVLVNTVNSVGVMGKGIALTFKHRFPDMFRTYRKACLDRHVRPGMILRYTESVPEVMNFVVKDHWRQPSRLTWVEECLRNFVENYHDWNITSIALPRLGALNGRLHWPDVHSLIRSYLGSLQDIDIFLYEFDPSTRNPLHEYKEFYR